jgi:hypothetical protein
MMLSSKVEHVTLASLESLEYDILFLESSCKKLQDSHAQDSFLEIKQLVAYGRSERYEEFTQVKNKKYARVDLNDAIKLLEK